MTEHDVRPIYYLWVYNPMDASVTITHNEDRPNALAATHDEILPELDHPGRLNGFAYAIKGGYRITDEHSKAIEDPFIIRQVSKALKKEETYQAQSHPRYHGPVS
jgi:hypothetical protein